jgi:hypothetical protein
MTTFLTAIEAAKLRVISRQVPAALRHSLSCEIAAGHGGNHIAFAAAADGGELWWWLCWETQTREVRRIDPCDGRRLDDQYMDDCLLPAGHPGPHSFDLHRG